MNEKRVALFAGSFDPITLGHQDIVEQACALFDTVIVTIGVSAQKKSIFSLEEREAMAREVFSANSQVKVQSFDGLVVQCARQVGAKTLIRGLRSEADFAYEFQMAAMNRELAPEVTTIFLPTSLKYYPISSSLVKDIASHGGDVSGFVSPIVYRKLTEKFSD